MFCIYFSPNFVSDLEPNMMEFEINIEYNILRSRKTQKPNCDVWIKILLWLTIDELHLLVFDESLGISRIALDFGQGHQIIELGWIWMNRQWLMVGKGRENPGDDGEWRWNNGEWWWDKILSIWVERELRRQSGKGEKKGYIALGVKWR